MKLSLDRMTSLHDRASSNSVLSIALMLLTRHLKEIIGKIIASILEANQAKVLTNLQQIKIKAILQTTQILESRKK